MNEIEKSFSTEKYVVSYPVQIEQDGWRLDQFVMKDKRRLQPRPIQAHDVHTRSELAY